MTDERTEDGKWKIGQKQIIVVELNEQMSIFNSHYKVEERGQNEKYND